MKEHLWRPKHLLTQSGQSRRKIRSRNVYEGLCYNCGKVPTLDGKWCPQCKELSKQKNKEQRDKRRAAGLCYKCPQPAAEGFTHCQKHMYEARKRWYDYRQRVLDHYGRFCACCGENTEEFLGIDHINGGGNKHRKELGEPRNGSAFYKWIIDKGFPTEYQILCHNCNFAKGHYGECPHRRMGQ